MDMDLYKRIVIEYSTEEVERVVAQYGAEWLAEAEYHADRWNLPADYEGIIAAWADLHGYEPTEGPVDVAGDLEGKYLGEFESPEDYVSENLEDMVGERIPPFLIGHIDYGSIARDLRIGGDVTFLRIGESWSVHVFRNY